MCFLEGNFEKMQKFQILKILRAPLFKISEYAFN